MSKRGVAETLVSAPREKRGKQINCLPRSFCCRNGYGEMRKRMKPYYEDNHIQIFNKDCRDMSELPDESVQCIVTSPPYWGLRKYSGEQDLIWGDNHCEHQWVSKEHKDTRGVEGSNLTSHIPYKEGEARINYSDSFCSLCGAWRGQLGLEPTPELYIRHCIEILREIKRVLRKDGVVFWNIGDSYFGDHTIRTASKQAFLRKGDEGYEDWLAPQTGGSGTTSRRSAERIYPWKPKDLCLIPFRIAIAAQEDGWWVRSVIIWSKPNPMPESVKDRPTESHEYILMLTKSARYYWDQEAVREPSTEKPSGNISRKENIQPRESHFATSIPYQPNGTGRNIRTVWEFPTKPGPGKEIRNFAVFPEKLPDLCIKAATPEVGCCSKCGAPWVRVIKKGFTDHDGATQTAYPEGSSAKRLALLRQAARQRGAEYQNIKETIAWQPTCNCNADKVPSLVLDPLMGSGTTLWVAKKLGREAVGYELSEQYCQLAIERCQQQVLV